MNSAVRYAESLPLNNKPLNSQMKQETIILIQGPGKKDDLRIQNILTSSLDHNTMCRLQHMIEVVTGAAAEEFQQRI